MINQWLLMVGLLVNGAATFAQAPRVAVFAQPDFPYYGVNSQVTPERIAEDLRAAGIAADLCDGAALSDANRMNARRYTTVILPYGNTFPVEAFTNLRRFHREGGSLTLTGIPFTHPAERLSAKEWDATPGWGQDLRVVTGDAVPDGGGRAAVRVRVGEERWTGLTSARFPVLPRQSVEARVSAREVTPRTTDVSGGEGRQDDLFIRFFDGQGKYLEQTGVMMNAPSGRWAAFRGRATVPANAVAADVSAQLHRTGRQILLKDFVVTVDGKAVPLPNADFARRGAAYVDLGHDGDRALWTATGIGVGGFAGPDTDGKPVRVSAGDPFRLSGVLKESTATFQRAQWLDPASVPSGVRVIPAVGDRRRPVMALIVHENDAFRGAVDAWTYFVPEAGDREEYETRQAIVRGTIAALERKGRLNRAQARRAFAALDARPRPPVYAGLVLPEVPRRYETFQPKMAPPSRHLRVADVRKLRREERTLLLCLQGLVNRKEPRIYFIFDDADEFWRTELQRQRATDDPIAVSDPFSLLETFKGEFRGAVVADPKVYASACVALSIAGTENLLFATPELAARFGIPIVTDLRGRFRDNAGAMRYLRQQVYPRSDPYLTCSLDPAIYGETGGIDQIVAARGTAFWITGPKSQGRIPGADQAAEMAELRAWFAAMPLGAVVRGFWWHGDGVGLAEDEGVALGSRFGKVTLVSDLINNLSVHSGVRPERLLQKERPKPPALDRTKVYLAFTMSDGDNLCTWREYFRRYFNDPLRGTFPIGWGMGPTLIDLAPTWVRWYYEQATPNDEFICDVSGVAYIYPPSWATALKDRDGAFRWFYGRTQEYLERMDMRTIRLMNVGAKEIADVATLMPRIDFLMPDYGYAGVRTYTEMTYRLPGGTSVFRAATAGRGPRNLADQIRERVAKAPRPAFLNAFIWNWGSSLADLKQVLDLLGPEFVAVTPSQLAALYREARTTTGEGNPP
ncbi:MAG: GxGYxYP family putative glycoside hydrolase [Capsulimonadales bacterium]|nr:GxGYxYP family putative glycoside hydrolase [Capsulimonadales bacterium]